MNLNLRTVKAMEFETVEAIRFEMLKAIKFETVGTIEFGLKKQSCLSSLDFLLKKKQGFN